MNVEAEFNQNDDMLLDMNVFEDEVLQAAGAVVQLKNAEVEDLDVDSKDVIDPDKDEGQSKFKHVSIQIEQEASSKNTEELKEENAHFMWMIQSLKSNNEKLEAELAEKEDPLHKYKAKRGEQIVKLLDARMYRMPQFLQTKCDQEDKINFQSKRKKMRADVIEDKYLIDFCDESFEKFTSPGLKVIDG
ncbi:hypothetical protein QVD17_20085 [Tagetes erecta]|uniref:Uncharacterized protein n=1 Tax=Tagetes erecta TaxID=13708 RepID=A0AAD8KKU6_TARER|nr:hypothetical protein QVD17_20085 [Tagetes erecta]